MQIATLEDVPAIKQMAVDFMEVSGYRAYSDDTVIENLIINLISSDPREKIIVYKPDVGFIAGVAVPFIFGKDHIATEIAWWVNPEARGGGDGLTLLKAFEYWAKNIAQCKLISMVSLNKDVEKLYKKSGYKLYERAYMKVL